VTAFYGYGILAAIAGVVALFGFSALKSRRLAALDNQAGAAKQHAQDLRTGLDAAVEAGDDQAVQDALEEELHRPKP
jgi:hypothetical protein